MAQVPFPGPGQEGEEPPPGDPVWDGAGVPVDDWDPDREMAAYIADLDAGRARIPEEWEIEGPAVTISLGDAADVDPAELAAMVGPEGLGGGLFARDRPADVMRPGPVLSALAEGAVANRARLSDDQLLGAVSAARRLAARAEFLELTAIGEFTRRREAQVAAAEAAKVRPGRRPGEFADAELGMELVTSVNAARARMELAADIDRRLPATRAALAAGLIDGYRAVIIGRWTRFLTDADAAAADELLAPIAPGLRYEQLAKRAIAAAMKLDPGAMTRGKDRARAERQRVQALREDSGNASLSGRELAIEDVLASKAHIDAVAAALRRGGLKGSLRQLRVLAYLDLTQGRNPLDRLTPHPAGGGADAGTGDPAQSRPGGDADDDSSGGHPGDGRGDDADGFPDSGDGFPDGDGGDPGNGDPSGENGLDEDPYGDDPDDNGDVDGDNGDDEGGGGGGSGRGPGSLGSPSGMPAPFPALINLTIPAGTLFGWSTAPGEAGGWGLTDHIDTRRLTAAASAHPLSRWCITLTGADGTATAHGCARGPHPWTPTPSGDTATTGARDGPAPRESSARDGPAAGTNVPYGPSPGQAAAFAQFLHDLDITLSPIARGTCDHANAEDRYTPSRKLGHLVRARTATCPAPGCGAQAYHADLDHTLAYPAGATDECNLGPPCRRHHRVKQAPGWTLEQPEPGVMCWTTPSGRAYTTQPTVYDG